VIAEEQVREALKSVTDPEIDISVIDLGLIYGIEIDEERKSVKLRMTLTSPMCPAGPEILAAAEMAVRRIKGVELAEVELVWTPPWDPYTRCSDEAKPLLGIWE